jgi:hypothetical protein
LVRLTNKQSTQQCKVTREAHTERRVVGSGPRRTGRRSQPRDGRDSGPDQDRYGAHPNANRAPGDAGVTKREQDPLELQGIRVADQERLRSWGGRIYFRRGWGWGEGRRRRQRGACPRRGGRRGMASLRGLPLAESALRAAAAARPTAWRFRRIFGEMLGARHVRQQGAPRVCSSRGGGGASDSRALPEDFRRNVRRTERPTAGRSQRLSGMVRVSHVPQWTTSTGTAPHRMLCLECPTVCVCACIGLHEPHPSVISS